MSTGGSPARAPGRSERRPHLDGIRTVAVYLVLAFHAGSDRLVGGFIGVDVFFVLSGYLVTGVLERQGTAGASGLWAFYARRVRRLLPAALVVLVATAALFATIASPLELATARQSITAAGLYVSNWWFIIEDADYFGSELAASPVIHFWSLSVEEQFYVLWPLALLGLHRLARPAGRHNRRVLLGLVVALGAASATAAIVVASTDPTRAYYGTDTRAYQLLAGAALALVPGAVVRLRRRHGRGPLLPAVASLAVVGLVAAATSWLDVGPVTRGLAATVLAVVLIASLEAAEGGVARHVLSRPTIAYLGRISYGTYLWHWMVVVVVDRELELTSAATFAVSAAVATGLAALSHRVLETPILVSRSLDRRRAAVVAGGLACSVVVAVLVVPRVLTEPEGAVVAAEGSGTPIEIDAERNGDTDRGPSCPEAELCPLVAGDGPRVLLLGDSHAQVMTRTFMAVAERADLELATVETTYCPWVRGIKYGFLGGDCLARQDHVRDEILPGYDPEVVILVHRAVGDPAAPVDITAPSGEDVPGDSPEATAALEEATRDTVEQLRRDGRWVLVVEPVPVPPFDLLECLSTSNYIEECRFVATGGPLAQERVLRDLAAADDDVVSLDLDGFVCPYLPICDPIVDGRIVMHDDNHLGVPFALTLVDPIASVMDAHGLLDR